MRASAILTLAVALSTVAAAAQSNPVKVATVARFDLFGTGTGPLTNGYMLAGDASVAAAHAAPEALEHGAARPGRPR